MFTTTFKVGLEQALTMQPWTHVLDSENYRNDPKFSYRQVWANSVDPGLLAVWTGSTLSAILFVSFGHIAQ